ncbi:MAG TPA: glycosyltransferase [Candidatus Polarisedimenticolia bacterium]|nr:glycosyltransferase [Candidatus Polarisedimenticolia bacterium]
MLKVAYIANTFPRWGGGWLLNEARGVTGAGIDLVLFSFNRPSDEVAAQPGMKEWIARTTYLPRGDSKECLSEALGFIVRHPLAFLRGVVAALRVGGRTSHKGHLMEVFFLASRIRRSGAVHVHAQHADYVADMAMAAAACLRLPFSFAGHARDMYTHPGRLKVKIRAARFVATCTGFNETYLKELCAGEKESGLDPGKIARVYHGVDLERFGFLEKPAPATRLISVARLKEKKGYPYLLEALVQLKKKGRDVTLEIYGDGDQKQPIEDRIRTLGLHDRVTLKGAIEHDRIPAALASAGAFVLACVVMPDQDRDGIPNTIIESLATGVPVISTAISGIPEVVRDGVSGLLVPERDPAALAAAIERLISDPELRARCGREGRRIVEADFSVEATGRTLAGLFRRAVAPAGTAS